MKYEQRHKNNFNSNNSGSSYFPLWEVDGIMATRASIGDDVITAGIIVGGGLVLYTLYRSFQVGEQTASYVGTKIDDTQDYINKQANRITGAPEWAWRETLGSGGLGLTGSNKEDDRTLLGKDEGSWGWGYGPKKGWLFGKD
tara:strand:- start:232 stop:657 length:426 start_codon:yes stop_codon:yes gene_type:complete